MQVLYKGKICIKVVPLCKLHLVAASLSYTCAQDGLDTVQLALVVFFLHQLAKILHLQSQSSSPAATCAGGVFPGALAHLLMCAQTNRHTLVMVFLCGGCDCMWWWLYVVVEAVHGGDGHLYVWQCMVVLLYDCICARCMVVVYNE